MRIKFITLLVLVLVSGGCQKDTRKSDVPHPRLVTFSPAITKLVFDMKLGEHVVGVTSFCRVPQGQQRPVVGSALSIRVEPILAVDPDVVLTMIESKRFEPLRKVRPDIRIEHFTFKSLEDIATGMERIGQIVGRPNVGQQAGEAFRKKLQQVQRRTAGLPQRRVMFVIGYEDPLAPGEKTFIDEMITLAGGKNTLAKNFHGWKRPSIESIVRSAPDVIICQSNPAKKDEAGNYWRRLFEMVPAPRPRVIVVSDADWTVPAGHMADYTGRLAEMIHPKAEKQSANTQGPNPKAH